MRIVILFITILFSINTFAQSTHTYILPKHKTIYSDSTSYSIPEKKPWRALAIGTGINLGIFGFNRYVTKEDFAYISLNSIKRNLKTVPVWDTDLLATNFIGHPYHGGLYFTAARTNGYSFYESIPFTLLSSLVWEFTLENERPSINDLISTPIGGAAVGELSYRLSDLILDNNAYGGNRFIREFFGAILAPTRFIDRLVTGELWAHTGNRGNHLPINIPLAGTVAIGSRYVHENNNTNNYGFSTTVGVEYGDIFEYEIRKPYEWFEAGGQLNIIASGFSLTEINIIGALSTYELYNKNNWQLHWGLFQHFHYHNPKLVSSKENDFRAFYISEAASAGAGLVARNTNGKFQFDGKVYLNGIALGASVSDYFKLDNRDYNMGSGFSVKAHTELRYNKSSIGIKAENYNIYSWKNYDPNLDLGSLNDNEIRCLDTQGENSVARLYQLGLSVKHNISDLLYLGLEGFLYIRDTTYKHMTNVNYKAWDSFLHLGFIF